MDGSGCQWATWGMDTWIHSGGGGEHADDILSTTTVSEAMSITDPQRVCSKISSRAVGDYLETSSASSSKTLI